MLNKIVEIRPVPTTSKQRPRLFSGVSNRFRPSFHRYSGTIITGLEDVDDKTIEFISRGIGISVENLKDSKSNFWTNFSIHLTDKTKVLDLTRPDQLLQYYFAKSCKLIANSESEAININSEASYYIHDMEEESTARVQGMQSELKALSIVSKLKSLESKQDLVKLITRKSVNGMSETVLLDKLFLYAKRKPEEFIKIYEDSDKAYKIVLLDCLHKGILQRKSNAIYEGSERVASSMDAAIDTLKNNQEYFTGLKSKLESN